MATVETTKHRIFVFVEDDELLEHGVIGFGFSDTWFLGVLSSRIHICWTLANGGTLEDRPRYNKDVCFDPFPFPAASEEQILSIRAAAEDIDKHRRRVLAEHPRLTLTSLYNTLEKVRNGAGQGTLEENDRRNFAEGLILVLGELHDILDTAVADAYGWRADMSDDEILAKLVALNKRRAQEEARGIVRWLRPQYQVPRFGSPKDKAELDLGGVAPGQEVEAAAAAKPSFPPDDVAQTAAVMAVLAASQVALAAEGVAASFRQGRRNLTKVEAVLAALTRMGFVSTADEGKTFALRRVA